MANWAWVSPSCGYRPVSAPWVEYLQMITLPKVWLSQACCRLIVNGPRGRYILLGEIIGQDWLESAGSAHLADHQAPGAGKIGILQLLRLCVQA
jgi:hypothetical protein